MYTCPLSRTTDAAVVEVQTYHEKVFVGNHCKVVLAKDRDVVFNFCKVSSKNLIKKFMIYMSYIVLFEI